MALRQLLYCGAAVASHAVGPAWQRGAAVSAWRCVSTTRMTRFAFEGQKVPAATGEEETGDPAGTPWTPTPVAEDYEETIQILLGSRKVEDALDIFGRMVKRGFRPSSQIVDEIYALAKTKPEWQAAAVKTINAMDLSSLK